MNEKERAELVARALRLLEAAAVSAATPAPGAPAPAPEYAAMEPGAYFAGIESLLARALEKTRAEHDAAAALHRAVPEVRDADLLLIELCTKLFEGVRALRYQVDVLTKACGALCVQTPAFRAALDEAIRRAVSEIGGAGD